MEVFLSCSQKEKKIEEILTRQKREKVKWCEIDFSDIRADKEAYRYGTFSIWYYASWSFSPVLLCLIPSSLSNHFLHKFRKYSSSIQ